MFKKVLIAEDFESFNISVQKVLKDLKVENPDYAFYCDDAFLKVKKAVISSINRDDADGESITDLLMCAKYFERIGDHAVNVAKWAIYAG